MYMQMHGNLQYSQVPTHIISIRQQKYAGQASLTLQHIIHMPESGRRNCSKIMPHCTYKSCTCMYSRYCNMWKYQVMLTVQPVHPKYTYCTFVGHRLATEVLIGKLPATRGVWVIIGQANDERGQATGQQDS